MAPDDEARSTSTAGVLVGRDDELSMLQAALDAARSARPTIALLVGEAGIGKTRLADEAAVMARADGMRVLLGEPTRRGANRWSCGAASTARSEWSRSAIWRSRPS